MVTHNTSNSAGDFNLYYRDDNTWDAGIIQCALLADIRRELRNLNSLLRCPNFIGIPETLRKIDRNTTKRTKSGENHQESTQEVSGGRSLVAASVQKPIAPIARRNQRTTSGISTLNSEG